MSRLALATLLLGLAACAPTAPIVPADAGTSALTGTVAYRARIALPPDAVLTVRLEDTRRADAPAPLVAETATPTEGRQVPLAFRLPYDPSRLAPGVRYTVRATIADGAGRLLWTTTTATSVDLSSGPPAPLALTLEPVPARPTGEASLAGVRWRLVGMVGPTGEPVVLPPGERLTLTLGTDGSYHGEAGCNGFGGSFGAASGTPTLGPARSTLMACPEPSAARAFLRALGGARATEILTGTMTLVGPAGDRLTFEDGLDAWDERRTAGVTFHAVGQEPGWTLDVIHGQRLVLVADYGERRVETPDPVARTDGNRTVYQATTESHDLRVEIVARPCADGMSGAPYPAAVTVTLDGQTYAGCGRWLDG